MRNPTLRGFAIIALIAAVITAFSLQPALGLVLLVLQVVFLAAIAYTLLRLWKRNRGDIATWPVRSRSVFYGAVALGLVDVAAAFLPSWPTGTGQTAIFFFVLAASVFAMWRVWRDEHTYGY